MKLKYTTKSMQSPSLVPSNTCSSLPSSSFHYLLVQMTTTNNNPFGDFFSFDGHESHDPFVDSVNSTWKSMNTTIILLAVVSAISAVVIVVIKVVVVIRCLRTTLPTHAQITFGTEKWSKLPNESSAGFPVIPDSQIREAATMEKFLSNMAREKPIRFSPDHLSGFTHNFSTLLGTGAFGMVYQGQFPDGTQVAVKVLNGSDKTVEQQFMAEVSTMGRTYHINLVRLYGFCFDTNLKALVYEYMENGSLDKLLLDENQNQAVEWERLHEIAIGTAKGIAYLHEECEQKIIHYDIKPENVLLDSNLNPKVADFGLARLFTRDRNQISMTHFKGTPRYAAPKLYMPYPVTLKCDVYSFGMLLFEIVGRRRNHDAELRDTQLWLPKWTWKRFEKNELLEMVSFCGVEENDREKAVRTCMVALWCVQYLPGARPDMSTVVKMLEGGIEVTPPPNPFEHLESHGPNDLVIPERLGLELVIYDRHTA